MLMDGDAEIHVTSDDIARELIICWKHADCKVITANANYFNLMVEAKSMLVNMH